MKYYHQIKRSSGLNVLTAESDIIVLHFSQGRDSKYGRFLLGTGKNQAEIGRVVFSDVETGREFWLVTSLSDRGEERSIGGQKDRQKYSQIQHFCLPTFDPVFKPLDFFPVLRID